MGAAVLSGETKGLQRVLETSLSLRLFDVVNGDAMLSLLKGNGND